MRNRALDGSADGTDLVIVFVFAHVEFTVLRLLSRRDVARPLKSLVCDNRSGKIENLLHLAFPLLHVMVTSGSRVRDEDNVPEFVADNQAAMAVVLYFPAHISGARSHDQHGHNVPSTSASRPQVICFAASASGRNSSVA
jgi:hypothetical protein